MADPDPSHLRETTWTPAMGPAEKDCHSRTQISVRGQLPDHGVVRCKLGTHLAPEYCHPLSSTPIRHGDVAVACGFAGASCDAYIRPPSSSDRRTKVQATQDREPPTSAPD